MLKRWLTQGLTVISVGVGQSLSWPAVLECTVIDDYSQFLPLEFQPVFLSLSDGLLQYAPEMANRDVRRNQGFGSVGPSQKLPTG